MKKEFLKSWMKAKTRDPDAKDFIVLEERLESRTAVEAAIAECVTDHLAGLDIIAHIGSYKKAAAYIRNKLPATKRVRSGDF